MSKTKKSLVLLAVLFASVLLNACGGNEDEPKSEDKYFVKYEVDTSSKYHFQNIEVVITTENGIDTMIVDREWEGIFGPLNPASSIVFKAHCIIPEGNSDYYTSATSFKGRISVSKNGDPFVLKAESQSSHRPLEMTYSIDF